MIRIVYYVWFLLPLALFVLALSAGVRSRTGKLKKGYAGFYFKQGVISLIIFALAIFIDRNWFDSIFEPIAVYLTSKPEVALTIGSWLIYPALLFICSLIAGFFASAKPQAKKTR